MNAHLKETKKIFKPLIQKISKAGPDRNDLLEAAFFAYAHRNPLIDRIFWGRLNVVLNYVNAHDFKNILDFGCGSGVTAYALAMDGKPVMATDIDPQPLSEVLKFISFPPSFGFINPETLATDNYRSHFDAIIALDVLEHVNNLETTINFLKSRLKSGGEIIVSGPTENFLYKIGRRLAGSEFTGDYHKTDIGAIRKAFEKTGSVATLSKIYPILPLFDIFSATTD